MFPIVLTNSTVLWLWLATSWSPAPDLLAFSCQHCALRKDQQRRSEETIQGTAAEKLGIIGWCICKWLKMVQVCFSMFQWCLAKVSSCRICLSTWQGTTINYLVLPLAHRLELDRMGTESNPAVLRSGSGWHPDKNAAWRHQALPAEWPLKSYPYKNKAAYIHNIKIYLCAYICTIDR